MLTLLQQEKTTITEVAFECHCSDTNVMKSINNATRKIWRHALPSLPARTLRRSDLCDPEQQDVIARLAQAFGETISLLEQELSR